MSNMTIPSVPANSTIYETLGNSLGGYEWYDATGGYYYEKFLLGTNQPVAIALTGTFDTWLGIQNLNTGELVAWNDDGGVGSGVSGTNSALSFTPLYGNTYAVIVSSGDFAHNTQGNYQLTVASLA